MSAKRMIIASAMTALALVPLAARAQPNVSVDSTLFVEKQAMQRGVPVRQLEPAGHLSRGERVVTLVTWYRLGGDGGFTVTDALPADLSYQACADRDEEVSVDGGRIWGHLGSLRIGSRLATAQDVTHVRWHISPAQAEVGTGYFAYSGTIR